MRYFSREISSLTLGGLVNPSVCVWGGKGFRDFFKLSKQEKHLNSGANQIIFLIVPSLYDLMWSTNREVKVTGWSIWRQHMRRTKDPQHALVADPLSTAFKTNPDFLSIISHFVFLPISEGHLRFRPLGQSPTHALWFSVYHLPMNARC